LASNIKNYLFLHLL